MKKIILFIVSLSIPMLSAHAASAPYSQPQSEYYQAYQSQPLAPMGISVSAEYPTFRAELNDFDDSEIDFEGFALTLSSNPHVNGMYGKFEIQKNREFKLNFYELDFGAQLNFFNQNGVYALATVGIGYAWINSDLLYNDLNFLAIPIGLELGYSPAPNMSIYGGVGYKWLIDVTPEVTCRDGGSSYLSFNHDCGWQGGIAHYNDNFGDLSGVTTKLGLRYNF